MSKKNLLIIDANDTVESSHDMTFQRRTDEGKPRKKIKSLFKEVKKVERQTRLRVEKWRMLITIDVVFSLLNFHAFQSTDRKFPERSLAIFLSLAATVRHSLLIKKNNSATKRVGIRKLWKVFNVFFFVLFVKLATKSRGLKGDYFLMIYSVDSLLNFAFISFADLLLNKLKPRLHSKLNVRITLTKDVISLLRKVSLKALFWEKQKG